MKKLFKVGFVLMFLVAMSLLASSTTNLLDETGVTSPSGSFTNLTVSGYIDMAGNEIKNVTNINEIIYPDHPTLITAGLNIDSGTLIVNDTTDAVTFKSGYNIGVFNSSDDIWTMDDFKLTSEDYVHWYHNGGQAASRDWGIIADTAVYGDFAIVTTDAQDHTLDTTRLYINPSGNVGINTTTPSQTLTVAGTFNATGQASMGANLTFESGNYICLDGAACEHYIYHNGTHTVMT